MPSFNVFNKLIDLSWSYFIPFENMAVSFFKISFFSSLSFRSFLSLMISRSFSVKSLLSLSYPQYFFFHPTTVLGSIPYSLFISDLFLILLWIISAVFFLKLSSYFAIINTRNEKIRYKNINDHFLTYS